MAVKIPSRYLYSLFMWVLLVCFLSEQASAHVIKVGSKHTYKTIKKALLVAQPNDTVIVFEGVYQEGNIVINKPIVFMGINQPVLDGQSKFEILSVKANGVTINGFTIKNSGYATLDDPGGIKVYDSEHITIENNILDNNFFGIYIQYGKHCIIKNNRIKAYGIEEQQIGNGIHCWKSDSLLIIGNNISGHRDGIYFEFVTGSVIWRNVSYQNIRYGLHFMFSNNDAYISNTFKNNGAGVAVMFTHKVKMINNILIILIIISMMIIMMKMTQKKII